MKRLPATDSSAELKLERQQVKELQEVSFWMIVNTAATIATGVATVVTAILIAR